MIELILFIHLKKVHHDLPEKYHWQSSSLFVFVFIFDFDNLATSSTLPSIGSDKSCVVTLLHNSQRTLGQPLLKFQAKNLAIPQVKQFSPFCLLLFIFWTLHSFVCFAVVELYVHSHLSSFAFYHACTIPPPQCQRSYAAFKRLKAINRYWFSCDISCN